MDGALRSFSSFMGAFPSRMPWVVLWGLVLSPVLVLIHELGHATVVLARTEGLVRVEVGRQPAPLHGRFGRLVLAVSPIPARSGVGGRALAYARMPARDRIAVALAGPLAQAAASLAVLLVALDVHSTALAIVAVLSFSLPAVNLMPFTRAGQRSDGLQAADAVRELRSAHTRKTALNGSSADMFRTELADTVARWLVLFTDAKSAFRTETRSRLLGGAPVALGHSPEGREPESLALWRLAWAGWCWREVERGDPQRLREAALDAVHQATVAGKVEPDLTALAARFLAMSGTDLGLASPGADDGSRTAFLAAAFARLDRALKPESIAVEQQQFAFRYGVALRDVERVRS
jgi:hypothetical protein